LAVTFPRFNELLLFAQWVFDLKVAAQKPYLVWSQPLRFHLLHLRL
jgi:hypothetical protein